MNRPLKFTLITLLTFLVLVSGSATAFAFSYKSKAYPHTKVAGVDVSGMSKESVNAKLVTQVATYLAHPVVVTMPDISQPRLDATGDYPQIEVKTTAADLGLQFDQTTAEQAVWNNGHTYTVKSWPQALVNSLFRSTSLPLAYSVDPKKIDTFVSTQIVPKITTPTPAKVSVSGTNVVIADEKPGLTVDTSELSKRLAAALPTAIDQDTLYLKAPVQVVDSTVTRATVQPLASELDALGNLSMTMQNGTGTIKPVRADVLSWFSLVQDDKNAINIVVNSDSLDSFIKTKGGSAVDVDASLKIVTDSLNKSLTEYTTLSAAQTLSKQTVAFTMKPVVDTTVAAGNYTSGMFPGKYIEVSLADQKMYRMNGTNLEKVYRVSSGKWSTPTPVGTFTITSKSPRAYSAEFGLYMPNWMNFTGTDVNGEALPVGAYGVHELPEWPNGYKEGANHIGTPVSHGCVRLGVGDAAEMYAWADIGTPVYIH